MTTATNDVKAVETRPRFSLLSTNPGKRAAEKWYLIFFLLTIPVQALVNKKLLSYVHPNDLILITKGLLMGIGAWGGSLIFRAREDRGKPFHQVYGFKLGCFLFVWAVIGGYLGTDPWYEVLHGHFAFNTAFNPNDVPFFMLPMTIAVFGAYVTVLGVLFRVIWRAYESVRIRAIPDFIVKAIVFVPLAMLMPLVETFFYTSPNYCFDNPTGQWFLNVFIYGSWHFAALWFFVDFDETPGQSQPWLSYVVKGFATVGILLLLMQLVSEWVAPHFTEVKHGARYLNDWSVDNCLGPKPER